MKKYLLFISLIALASCYNVERNCTDFKNGKFLSEIEIDGVKHQTVTVRTDTMVIETYKGQTDTSSIRWVNDCEYVLRKHNPKTMAEKRAVSVKILTTSDKTYTFEFGSVGHDKKQKGTATRLN
ncbi:DNA topoisomerase IV [Flavobacterium caeni]|uniref:DNA topoisomerase IV n=1 Tax=Flavobacterium caeni TaxID=490189 RepID=A0A1G5IUD5_9FLAO|nr:DNA topoisomerase IV [Flavobacterium caeni]SCY79617.1 hypothetical protein SAMN02927903_02399 [Flavobacterium caeni]